MFNKNSIFSTKTIQEDTRDAQTKKRVANHIQQQQQQILARSLRPHRFECYDPITCENLNCYKWEADKIVAGPYTVDKKTRKII